MSQGNGHTVPSPQTAPEPRHEFGKLYFEQNRLLWSRLQTAYLVEAGTLAGYYVTLQDDRVAMAVGALVLGVVLLLMLTVVTFRDVQFLTQMRHAGWLPLGQVRRDFTLGIPAKYLAIAAPLILVIANIYLLLVTLVTQDVSAMTANTLLQLLTAATALIAVIIGPFVTYHVAKRQIHANVVSTSRQAWINALRDAIADFLSKSFVSHTLRVGGFANEASILRIEEMVRLVRRIELFINPNEADHRQLVELVGQVTNDLRAATEEGAGQRIEERQDQIVNLAQRILKQEWDRVKRGD